MYPYHVFTRNAVEKIIFNYNKFLHFSGIYKLYITSLNNKTEPKILSKKTFSEIM